jgi:large conductance mechanosensitive channel
MTAQGERYFFKEGRYMKKFFDEFKEFINQGSVMDMAVGVIIGGAFKGIVDSLVNDILSPILGAVGGANLADKSISIGGATLGWGNFITSVINFLIMAFVIFSIVKALNKAKDLMKKPAEETPAAPTTKICPYCRSEIAIEATKCPHCTSDL